MDRLDEAINRIYNSNDEKIPRKIKKKIFGKKVSKKKLRQMLESVEVIDNKYPEMVTIKPYFFCPRCGCELPPRYTGNMVEYPERYEKGFCVKCGFLLIVSDNSPYITCFEFKEDNYIIDW